MRWPYGGPLWAITSTGMTMQEITDVFRELNATEVALETLAKRAKINDEVWSNYKLAEKCETCWVLKAQKTRSTEDAQNYRAGNIEVKKEIKVAKEKWIQNHCDQIQSGFRRIAQVRLSKVYQN